MRRCQVRREVFCGTHCELGRIFECVKRQHNSCEQLEPHACACEGKMCSDACDTTRLRKMCVRPGVLSADTGPQLASCLSASLRHLCTALLSTSSSGSAARSVPSRCFSTRQFLPLAPHQKMDTLRTCASTCSSVRASRSSDESPHPVVCVQGKSHHPQRATDRSSNKPQDHRRVCVEYKAIHEILDAADATTQESSQENFKIRRSHRNPRQFFEKKKKRKYTTNPNSGNMVTLDSRTDNRAHILFIFSRCARDEEREGDLATRMGESDLSVRVTDVQQTSS